MVKVKDKEDSSLTSGLSKVESINSLEVVTTSQKPNRSYLSKYLIAWLSYGGVPNEFFIDILKRNSEEADHIYTKSVLPSELLSTMDMDEHNAAAMILCGIPPDESFLQVLPDYTCKSGKIASLEKGNDT
ncbi:RNA-directed RNA polymerase [Trifolium repens]|jgi:RNA-dependent RNA polymerase|nr:RNA-dependent RNA polymerase family protein [Trifolium repens]WJX29973.1 RNA-directed RNA polymerase [Trifolium repens]